jgi:hypothetical protein
LANFPLLARISSSTFSKVPPTASLPFRMLEYSRQPSLKIYKSSNLKLLSQGGMCCRIHSCFASVVHPQLFKRFLASYSLAKNVQSARETQPAIAV